MPTKTKSIIPATRFLSLIFLIFVVVLSFISGAFLQRYHAFTPLKRLLEGRPLYLAPPTRTILSWEYDKINAFQPQYPLINTGLREIEKNRSLYLEKLKELLRLSEFPLHSEPQTRVLEKAELAKVLREKIEIEVEPGLWIPFYLFIPKNLKAPGPCILVLHGHSAGKIETAGLMPSYQKGNALFLAAAGFVTAAPDFRGFGELGWQGEWEDPLGHEYGRSIHIQDVLNNLKTGRTVLGSYLFDMEKILDYLGKRSEIDPKRIGVTGTSMGADIAIWLAVIDPRIQVIVASSSPLVLGPSRPSDFSSYHPCIDAIPGIFKFFRPWEIPLLIPPRPLLFDLDQRGIGDPIIHPQLEKLYRESGQPEKLSFHFHSEGDSFHNDIAAEWFKKWL